MDKISTSLSKIAQSSILILIMTSLTVTNCIVLAVDRFPIEEAEQRRNETINLVISICFFLDMIIKIGGLGIRQYLADRYNMFDALIVLLSVVEISISLY